MELVHTIQTKHDKDDHSELEDDSDVNIVDQSHESPVWACGEVSAVKHDDVLVNQAWPSPSDQVDQQLSRISAALLVTQ